MERGISSWTNAWWEVNMDNSHDIIHLTLSHTSNGWKRLVGRDSTSKTPLWISVKCDVMP